MKESPEEFDRVVDVAVEVMGMMPQFEAMTEVERRERLMLGLADNKPGAATIMDRAREIVKYRTS